MPFQAADQPKKRTRVLAVRQSSRGCLTCKHRRIKCDETRPECLRCQRSKRFCAGHGYLGFPPSEEGSSSLAVIKSEDPLGPPTPALTTASVTSASGRELSQLACNIIAADSYCLFGPAESLFFSRLLPQFNESIPFVSAAAAAFGAAYRAGVLKDEGAVARSEVQYMKAIRLLQNELNGPLQQFIPLFISSILLAGAEVVSGRRRNALVHLLSIFAIFCPHEAGTSTDQRTGGLLPAVNEIQSAGGSAEDFGYVLIALDIQIALFAWAKPPVLHSRFHQLSQEPLTIDELTRQHPIIVHACMHFIGTILQENETNGHIDISTARLDEQAQLTTALRQWLFHRSTFLADAPKPLTISRLRYLAVLAAQCHSILITTSTILTSTQTVYDTHHPSFTHIISFAETVLGPATLPTSPAAAASIPHIPIPITGPSTSTSLSPSTPTTTQPPIPTFSPSAGLILPLSLCARKCRHHTLRRQAIMLLLRTGNEGPLVGATEAALGRRVVEIEEGRGFGFFVPAASLVAAGAGVKPLLSSAGGKEARGSGSAKSMGRAEADTVVDLGRSVPENRRVKACWRVSITLPERMQGVVRFARPVDRTEKLAAAVVAGRAREGQDGGRGTIDEHEYEHKYEQEEHLEVWAEKIPEFELLDGSAGADAGAGGKRWATTKTPEVWSEWLDPKTWRLLPFEII